MSDDFNRTAEITERLGAAVEAELTLHDPEDVFDALAAVLATLIATMPRDQAVAAMRVVREGLPDAVEGARSKMQ